MKVKIVVMANSTRGGHPSPSVFTVLLSDKVEWVGCSSNVKSYAVAEARAAAKRLGYSVTGIEDRFKGKRII